MATNNFKFAQLQTFTLSGAGAIPGQTSIVLQSMQTIDSADVVMSNFGTIGFGTIDPGNGDLEEQISFTGITQNANGTATLTGVSNVTMVYPYTQTSGLSKTHAGATPFVISNTSGFYDNLVAKNDDGTITGQYTFNTTTGRPQLSSDVDTAVNEELVDFGQLSRTSFAGTVNASTVQKGIVQLPTQAQVDAKTATGSTSALLALTPDKQRSTLLSDYVADSGAANAYVITPSPAVTAYTTGQIFTFKATNANTTTSTLNVSALGVKTIKKLGATNLASGDIAAGSIVEVEYDGTNFQMLQPVANAPATNAALTAAVRFGGNGADGALSITSGTTTINLGSASYVEKNYTSISITGTGVLAFSNSNSSTGTQVVLRSQGAVTITSGATRAIDARSLGGGLGTAQTVFDGGTTNAIGGAGGGSVAGQGTANSSSGTAVLTNISTGGPALPVLNPMSRVAYPGGNGSIGGAGGGTGGAGGRGGGSLYIECAGAYNATGTIDVSAAAGAAGSGSNAGGGGGGGGGSVLVVYASLTADSATYTVAGGAGGAQAGAGGAGRTGADGASSRVANIYFY